MLNNVKEELLSPNSYVIYFEDMILTLVCTTVIIACLINGLYKNSNSPTLYDDVKSWPLVFIKNIILTYALFLCSILVTFSTVLVLSSHQTTLITDMRERPKRCFLWNYLFLELLLISIDKLRYRCHRIIQILFYLVWCALFAPSICIFDRKTVLFALKQTFMIMCALTAVAFLWNLRIQKYLMRKLVYVFLVTYVFLTILSIVVIVFGFPRNIFGLSLVVLAVHGGFLIHICLFIICTHVFVEQIRRGMEDVTHSAIDLFVCSMHIIGRIMIVNSYMFVVLKYECNK